MECDKLRMNLPSIKATLYRLRHACRARFLRECCRWLSQLIVTLDDVCLPDGVTHKQLTRDIGDDNDDDSGEKAVTPGDGDEDLADLAHDYMQCGELDRAAFVTEACTSSRATFLHLYSRYLSAERRAVEAAPEPLSGAPPSRACARTLTQLRQQLQRLQTADEPPSRSRSRDPFLRLLHAMVLEKLQLRDHACQQLCEALRLQPLFWPAWQQLGVLVADREQLGGLQLPCEPADDSDCDAGWFFRQLFTAHVYLELQMNAEAMAIYECLSAGGLQKWPYLHVQRAMGHQNMRQVDEAIELFTQVSREDPCRLQNMDSFSNLLFVKGMSMELCALAHSLTVVNKYAVETCCVVGNYYSLKNQHEKAVLYFQRALKVCPSYLSAWTLMGHEFLELKNTAAAIQCYRQAIDLNQLDYRAWYGLGQTYEILKMPYYCQYYYQRAYQLRPNDSRMLMAMGESYEKLERLPEAKRCYWKAHCIGDIEGVALLRLARLFERLGQRHRAAAAYTDYIRDADGQHSWDGDERAMAHRFLANYQLSCGVLDAAQLHATHCAQYAETRDEARAILREVAQRRCQEDGGRGGGVSGVGAVAAGAVTDVVDESLTTFDTSLSLRTSRRHQLSLQPVPFSLPELSQHEEPVLEDAEESSHLL